MSYYIYPGSTVDKVLKALAVAAVPMTPRLLKEAAEYRGAVRSFSLAIRRPLEVGTIRFVDGLYSLGDNPPIIRERRNNGGVNNHGSITWRAEIMSRPTVLDGKLRDLMCTAAAVSTGDPLRALADAMDAARRVMQAKAGTRFNGAEVDLLVAREMRSVTEAATLATQTLLQALEVLQ